MNATLLLSAVVLASLWTATEWTAWKLGLQSELGHPWFEPFGWTVYPAHALFWWRFGYGAMRAQSSLRVLISLHRAVSPLMPGFHERSRNRARHAEEDLKARHSFGRLRDDAPEIR
jgi:type IV secretory pathway TraG/TraD family ATPase VirD4